MKTFKKISLGLGLAALFAVIFQFMSPGASLASSDPFPSSSDWDNATYTMDKSSTIKVTFPAGDHSAVNFTDSAPGDSIHNYVADTNSTGVCSGSITFNGGQSFNNKPVAAQINVNYETGLNPTCTGGPPSAKGANRNYTHPISITNNTTNGGSGAADTGPATVTYDGQTYKQIEGSTAYGADTDVNDCYGGTLVVLDAVPTGPAASGGVKGTIIPTSKTSGGAELSSQVSNFPKIQTSGATGKCYYNSSVDNGDHTLLTVVGDGAATFAGCSKGDSACNGAPSTPSAAAASTGPTNSCEGSSNTGFEWIFCGVLRMFDKAANTLNAIIESLLTFDVKTYLNQDVHNAWSIFKNLASAILVIVLLMAVIAQALGGGPLDAYTIRKILPRLIIAVILMQISWYMLIWVIELANDLGHGMRDLLTAPFGGYSSLGLDKLVGQLGIAAPAGSEIAIFTTAGIAFAFSGITIGGMALLALSGVLSLIVGLLILLLREILIILCVILFPLAILAWILPGTQRYWKLWYDNFSKLLILFPLIMGVIYAGRIFAHIAGMPGGTGNHILAMFIVFVGYFAPYWFLPKTFKWGGQAFAAASSGVLNATKTARAYPRKVAMEGAKHNRELRARERNVEISQNPKSAARWKKALSGYYNVALSGGARNEQFAHKIAEGKKAALESIPQELALHGFDNLDHPQKLEVLNNLMLGKKDGLTGIDATNNRALQDWAFDQLADLGDIHYIRRALDGGYRKDGKWVEAPKADKNVLNAGINRKFGRINELATDMGLAPDLTTWAADKMGSWKDSTLQEWIYQVQNGKIRDRRLTVKVNGREVENENYGKLVDIESIEDAGSREDMMRRAIAQAQQIEKNDFLLSRFGADGQEKIREMARRGRASGTGIAEDPAIRAKVIGELMQKDSKGKYVKVDTYAQAAAEAFTNKEASSEEERNGYQMLLQTLDNGSPEAKEAASALRASINKYLSNHLQEAETIALSEQATPGSVEWDRIHSPYREHVAEAQNTLNIKH